ncbi:ring hydroxylating beta subunit (plasmid) [Blastomonas sp. RAC04]|uniref:aromatic-ring-hydroxylating dioxygenase subunit beta n=1 Tax=Blastomonas sp. RAC04 TaxID=1842535 RepID=UPI00083D82DE|nr:aromatic-ring-hydroxylating dioxygenase subunit beta [Blastomonas sp. RAC04]AOF98659.1 ring hydroxylating beta subunit [Blastomonas sp. RAC04]
MKIDPELRYAISDLYAAYTACLDESRYDEWADFFTMNAWYRIVARENFDRDLPLSLMSLKGRGMMKDRVYGITSTIFHAPYYQRHIVSVPNLAIDEEGVILASTNYVVVRTKRDMAAEVYNVGRYIDEIVLDRDALKFRKKFCVYDNDLIPNSLIYPV